MTASMTANEGQQRGSGCDQHEADDQTVRHTVRMAHAAVTERPRRRDGLERIAAPSTDDVQDRPVGMSGVIHNPPSRLPPVWTCLPLGGQTGQTGCGNCLQTGPDRFASSQVEPVWRRCRQVQTGLLGSKSLCIIPARTCLDLPDPNGLRQSIVIPRLIPSLDHPAPDPFTSPGGRNLE